MVSPGNLSSLGSGWTFNMQPVVCGPCFRKAAVYLVQRTAALEICAFAFWADILGKLLLDHGCCHWVTPNFLGSASYYFLLCLDSCNNVGMLSAHLSDTLPTVLDAPVVLAQHHGIMYASLGLLLLQGMKWYPNVVKRVMYFLNILLGEIGIEVSMACFV